MRQLAVVLVAACSSPSSPLLDAPTPVDASSDAVVDGALPVDPVAALGAIPGSCTEDRWCWRRPTPRGVRVGGIHHTSPNDLWLIGETGLILQWNGTAWREHVLPKLPERFHATQQHVFSITGNGPDDVWIAGGFFIYHWDGSAWTLRDTVEPGVDQQFGQIWEAPNGDVWVAMDYGVLKRSTAGAAFQFVDVPQAQNPLSQLGGIWGTSPDDVWITGRPSRKFRWNGATFSEAPTPPLSEGIGGGDLWGSGPDDIWSGSGLDGFLVHWNGTAWQSVETGLENGWYLRGIAGVASDDIWWIAQKSSAQSAFLHWDGQAITKTTFQSDVFLFDFEIVDGRWWIVGDHGAVFVKDDVVSPMRPAITPSNESFRAAWGPSDRDMWVVGPSLFAHWDGDTVTRVTLPANEPIYLVESIHGTGQGASTEIWAVGSKATTGRVHHYQSGTWSAGFDLDPTHPFNAVWAVAPGEAIVVGDGGTVYRHANGSWTPLASGVTKDLTAIWGTDADHVYIAGYGGTLLRWDRANPNALTPVATGTTADFTGIGGTGGNDGPMWLASRLIGDDNEVAVFERTATGFVRHPIPHYEGGPVHVNSANDVLFGSGHGQLFRWNGTSFVQEHTGFPDSNIEFVYQPPAPDSSPWIGGSRALLQQVTQ